MRRVLLAVAAASGIAMGASFVTASPASAGAIYPVCMFGPYNQMDCRYSSFAQCQATASGLGADCLMNPAAAGFSAYNEGPVPAPPPKVRRKHQRDYY
jgi:hypothetical protein